MGRGSNQGRQGYTNPETRDLKAARLHWGRVALVLPSIKEKEIGYKKDPYKVVDKAANEDKSAWGGGKTRT